MQHDRTHDLVDKENLRTDHSAPETWVSFPGEDSMKTTGNPGNVHLDMPYDFSPLSGASGAEVMGSPMLSSLPKGQETLDELKYLGDKKQLM